MVAESREVGTWQEDVVLVLWKLPNSLCFLSTCKFMEMRVGKASLNLNRGWNLNLGSKGKQKWKWMENSVTWFLQRKATARCPAGERPLLTSRILTRFHVPVRCLVTSPVTFWYTWDPNQVLPLMLLCESCQQLCSTFFDGGRLNLQ